MRILKPSKHGVYPKLLTPHIGRVIGKMVTGDGTVYDYYLMDAGPGRGQCISIPARGAGEFLHAASVIQVGACFPGLPDASVAHIADFINDQIAPGSPRLGEYREAFCDENGEDNVAD